MSLFGGSNKKEGEVSGRSVNQSALNLIMDQIKDLIEINTSLNKKYRDMESKLASISTDIGSDKKSVTDIQKKISELQSNMEKFIGLYEVITNQFNPFVDTGSETDNYEIDPEGNPVPIRRPSYGNKSQGGFMPSQSAQYSPGEVQGEMFVRGSTAGRENATLAGEIPENITISKSDDDDLSGQQKTNIEQIGGNVTQQKTQNETSMQNKSVDVEPHLFYDNTSSRTESIPFRGTSLDKLDVNSIIPLVSIEGNVNSVTTILSWMVYISKQCGENANDVLMYYTTIGWISPQVAKILSNYIQGLNVKPDESSDGKMDVADHIVSLFFIAKIKGVSVNAKTYRLISKIVKSKGFIIDE
ncbi:MAG: FlaD/FlaE family flagellar protein [Candidatus Woesearchaeota archaeon]